MAIVRTTPKETNTGGTGPNGSGAGASAGATAAPLDRTRSVLQQAPARPVTRQPGARPIAPGRTQTPAQTGGAPSAFLNDTITELRRVVWPTRAEVQAGTIVTIGLLIFFALYIFGLDYITNWLFHAIGLYPPTTNVT